MMFFEAFTGAFSLLLDPVLWVFIILGALWGVFVGAMPGIGTTLGYALLIPVGLAVSPVYAVAMLLALSVGSQFGNSIPAILLGIPGGAATIMTVLDGYSLTKRGQANLALGASYVAALGGQLISIPLFVLILIPLAGIAYVFQPPELFALYTLAFVAVISIIQKSMLKGILSLVLGMMLTLVGTDPLTGRLRLTGGIPELRAGLDDVALVVGILALGEIFRQLRQSYSWESLTKGAMRVRMPSFKALGGRDIIPALLGGTFLGTILGAIPGGGSTEAALVSYQQAKLWSRHPEEFGKGSLTGIVANESAQNASNSGELVPTLGLGIPASGSMLVLLAALTSQGIVPGPFLITDQPELLYATIAGLLGGTIFLLITGMWMATWMLRLARIDRAVVLVSALAIVVIGVYALHTRPMDLIVMTLAGVIGYFMYRYGFSPAAAALAIVLGEGFERSIRHGLALSNNSLTEMISRPWTAFLLSVALLLLIYGFWAEYRRGRRGESDRVETLDEAF